MTDRLVALRHARGWSQAELAARAGVTRQLIGAIEGGRHVPNVKAAIALSRALEVSVEDLFAPDLDVALDVLGDRVAAGTPLLTARVGDQLVSVPIAYGVDTPEAWGVADAVWAEGVVSWLPGALTSGMVIAGCDPVLGMIAGLVHRSSPHRIVTVHASTGRSIAALAAGRVHGVLVHAPAGELPEPPIPVRRWRVSSWQVGLGSSGPRPSVEELATEQATVVQRDPGAGTQQALIRALQGVGAAALPGPVGEGHIDVARRVSYGTGRAGVTMEAAALAFELEFTPLETHVVEFWLAEQWAASPGASVILDVLDGAALARRAVLLGGYDIAGCGTELLAS